MENYLRLNYVEITKFLNISRKLFDEVSYGIALNFALTHFFTKIGGRVKEFKNSKNTQPSPITVLELTDA